MHFHVRKIYEHEMITHNHWIIVKSIIKYRYQILLINLQIILI